MLPSWTFDDIEAELTAIVSLVPGCVYKFESPQSEQPEPSTGHKSAAAVAAVCVLYLPLNYRSSIKSQRLQSTVAGGLTAFVWTTVQILRYVAALGILISLALIAIFIVVFVVAVIVALATQQGQGGHGAPRRTRGGGMEPLLELLRTALWYHYLFGDTNNGYGGYGHGGMFFMSPFGYYGGYGNNSFFYWMMLRNMMRRRNPHIQRQQHEVQHNPAVIPPPQRRQFFSTMLAGLENTNEDDNDGEENGNTEGGSSATPKNRNVLGVVDEFLFGPSTTATKTLGGPKSVHEVWRLRACAVVGTASSSSSRRRNGVHPAQLLPYVENPPNVPSHLWLQHQQQQHSTKNETNPVVVVPQPASQSVDLSEALKIVVHFRGTPVRNDLPHAATPSCAAAAGQDVDADVVLQGPYFEGYRYYAFSELLSGIDRIAEGTTGYAESGGIGLGPDERGYYVGEGRRRNKRNTTNKMAPSSSSLSISEGGAVDNANIMEEMGPLLITALSSSSMGEANATGISQPASTPEDTASSSSFTMLHILCGSSSKTRPPVPVEWRDPSMLHDLLFQSNCHNHHHTNTMNTNQKTGNRVLPACLVLGPTVYTNLPVSLLVVCVIIAIINLSAVHWIAYYGLALTKTNPLLILEWPQLLRTIVVGTSTMMRYYSYLFVTVPTLRLLGTLVYNFRIVLPRQIKRQQWSELLLRQQPVSSSS